MAEQVATSLRPASMWRIDDVLIKTWDGELDPTRCVKCYAPSDGVVVVMKHRNERTLLDRARSIVSTYRPGGTVAEDLKKDVRVGVYICEHHRKRRYLFMLCVKLLAAAGALLAVLDLMVIRDGFLAAFGVFLFVVAMDHGQTLARRILEIDHVNDRYIYLLRACPKYLSKLPTMPMEIRRFD